MKLTVFARCKRRGPQAQAFSEDGLTFVVEPFEVHRELSQGEIDQRMRRFLDDKQGDSSVTYFDVDIPEGAP